MRHSLFRFVAGLVLLTLAAPAGRAAEPATRAAGPKYTFVLVHGAWGGGWAFKEVDNLLTAAGHKVYRPTLTGQGEKVHLATPDIDLNTHITDVANVILWEDLHDVVLVGHSYGGMVITGVADRVPDRLKQVVYLDAFLPENGESVNGGRGGRPTTSPFIPAGRGSENKPLPHDVPHPAKTFSQPIELKNGEATKKIPSTYILTVDKGRQPEQDTFFRFYQRAKARGWPVVIMEGDHNVQWSHPKELADLLENAPAGGK